MLDGIAGAGFFFQVKSGAKDFLLHRESVRYLYRVENFLLKKNYLDTPLMQPGTQSTQSSEALQSGAALSTVGVSKSSSLPIEEEEDKESVHGGYGSGVAKAFSPISSWADAEEEEDRLTDILQRTPSVGSGNRKQMYAAKFLNGDFLDQLPSMGQRRVPVANYFKVNREFKNWMFYLFDFVALFIDLEDIFESQALFKLKYVSDRIELLFLMERSDYALIPLQHPDNVGWSSSVKFLCQTLPGEAQISFLRTVLFFSVRKVARAHLLENQKAQMRMIPKSFLTGDKSARNDFLRVIRINKHAFLNNGKIFVDQEYAENYISDPHA